MRRRPLATALVAFTAGLTASAVLRRLDRRRSVTPAAVTPTREAPVVPAAARNAVVLPFTRPVVAASAPRTAPARCGDNGGRTKAGAPCGGLARSGGRCHHHRVAA